MYVKLLGILLVVGVGIGGYYGINKAIGNYNDAISTIAKLEQEQSLLKGTIGNLNKEIEEFTIRDALVSTINIKREDALQKNNEEEKERIQIIEENKDEECVMAVVPEPVADSLLSYARQKNGSRD